MADQLFSMRVEGERFSRQVKKWLKTQAPMAHKKSARALFMELLRRVILKTPVQTGRARGGWGAGAEALGFDVPRGPDYSGGRALSEFKQGQALFSLRISVINKVAYIEALESGTSKQAPFGMVRISVRELEQYLGGRKIPQGIQKIYQETWDALGLPGGTELRAGQIRDALGLGATI